MIIYAILRIGDFKYYKKKCYKIPPSLNLSKTSSYANKRQQTALYTRKQMLYYCDKIIRIIRSYLELLSVH